jgi:hypothetical protein
VSSLEETEGVKINFTNQGVVWHHHSARSEERFQIVRKLRTSGITGVHGNVNTASSVKIKFSTFENESSHFIGDGGLNSEDLLGNDRQHLKVDSIKLIETIPAT